MPGASVVLIVPLVTAVQRKRKSAYRIIIEFTPVFWVPPATCKKMDNDRGSPKFTDSNLEN